jgi:hypothetical protein
MDWRLEMKVPLCRPIFDKEMEDAAIYALQNEKFILGESVFKLKKSLPSIFLSSMLFQQILALKLAKNKFITCDMKNGCS